MKEKTTHYTNFGATMQPICADADGFLVYREDFQETIPIAEWTAAEIWINDAETEVVEWRKLL